MASQRKEWSFSSDCVNSVFASTLQSVHKLLSSALQLKVESDLSPCLSLCKGP